MRSLEQSIHRDRKQNRGCWGLGATGKWGSKHLMGTEFQFGLMRKSGRWIPVTAAQRDMTHPNCMLKNGENGQLYVTRTSPHKKTKLKRKKASYQEHLFGLIKCLQRDKQWR